MAEKIAVISEGPVRITKATIEAAWRRRKKVHRLVIRDLEVRGLALIVNPTTMVWSFAYRPRGVDLITGRRWPNKAVTLGNPATHAPEDARLAANVIKGQAAAGVDPAAVKKAKSAENQRQRGYTLERLFDDYKAVLPTRSKMRGSPGPPSARYVSGELAQLKLAMDEMDVLTRPVADLNAADILKLLEGRGTSRSALARFGALSRFLDWAHEQGRVDTNACLLIARRKRPKPPPARSNYLTPAEVARLWRAADNLRYPVWRDLVRFLLVVPCRRGEAAQLQWSHIDLATREWRQPSHLTKNREPHRVSLHTLAVAVINERRWAFAMAEAKGDEEIAARILASKTAFTGLVFPSPISGGAIDSFSSLKRTLVMSTEDRVGDTLMAAPLGGWSWHDFRRSFATALGEAGASEAVADAILNHRQSATRGGVLGVYQRASRWPEQVRAMEMWGALLTSAIEAQQLEVTSESSLAAAATT